MKRIWLFSLGAVLLSLLTFNAFSQRHPQPLTAEAPISEVKTEEPESDEPIAKAFMNGLIAITTYPMSVGTDTLVDMSSGTTQLVAPLADDTASPVTPIGFEFIYDGVRHSQFSVNANGLARLGSAAVTTAFNNATGFAVTTNEPKLAPYFDDLCVGGDGKVHYKVVGDAPNRKLVVEWFNMKMTRNATCTGATGNGTFQMWLHETSGVIEFVYGAIPAAATADAGYTVGLQAGAATNFASVSTAAGTVSYDTHNSTQLDAITEGKKFSFTPNVPAAPSAINFTSVTAIGMTVNWTDNSSNETGFAVYRSTDGINYDFQTLTAANATSYADLGLTPNTTYHYRVYAVSEGALSTAASGSQATAQTGNIVSAGAGGPWSSGSTWVGGQVPTSSDVVTITSGATVTIDTAAQAYAVHIGPAVSLKSEDGGGRRSLGDAASTLTFDATTARTLTVVTDVTVRQTGILASASTGTVTTHVLSIGGSLTNNGVLDLSTNSNTAGAGIVFTGAGNAVFNGTGITTDVRSITVNKGTSRDNVIELATTNFTVQGVSTDSAAAGYLTITNGTFKISGTFTADLRTFPAAAYTIPANGGLWLNNPNYSVTGQNGSPTLAGLLRMTQGTLNIGTSTGNSLGFSTGSHVIVEGGAVNAAGRFGVAVAGNAITYLQTGGTVTVQTQGNVSTTLAGFDMGTSTASSVTLTGGNIVVQLANTGGSGPRDYRHQSGSATTSAGIASVTGTVLQLGNASSGTAKTFTVRGIVPNLVIDNTSAGHTGQWDTVATNWNNISRNILINPGTTLNLGNIIFLFAGTTFTNNGTLVHNGASSRTYFFGPGANLPQTFGGSGTITAPLTSIDFDNALGVTLNMPVITNRVILFSGDVRNSGNLTVGNGGATASTIQIGNTTTPTLAGVFDQQINFNPGTGGIVFSYLRTGSSRTTGPEIPVSRTVTNLTYNDNDPANTLSLNAFLNVTGTLTLTEGRIVTSGHTLVHNGVATRTNGSVEGRLRRDYSTAGAYTYHVSKNGYSPVTANVTAVGSVPSGLIVEAYDSILGGFDPSKTVSRNWDVQESGDLTADLSFTYRDEDVNGNGADYRVYRRTNGTIMNMCPSAPCVNTVTNTGGPVLGVTDFSRWTVGENQKTTAAFISVTGRVFRGMDLPVSNARVTISGGNLPEPITVVTPPFGWFVFDNIPAASSYTITVTHGRYAFAPVVISGEESLGDVRVNAVQN
jgi:hypothetical protein